MGESAEADGNRAAETGFERVLLGTIDPARSRHMWTRSTVRVRDGLLVAGRWDGTVTAFEADTLEPRWTAEHPDHAVALATLTGGDSDGSGTVLVGGRGESGTIAAYDAETARSRWSYETAADVGEPEGESIFELPYVVALEARGGGDEAGAASDESDVGAAADGSDVATASAGADPAPRVYAAARRYERDGETRRWHSTVYAFDGDGSVRWRYEADASPIALDLDDAGDRLAVGYNRCPGDHQTGLVVLDADTGDLAWTWDPGTDGDRRIGDVAFDGDALAVASHGDKRGYLLGPRGVERWDVDLAVETDVGDETLYAYPNHVVATDGLVAFVTGNTYATDRRETEGRHPNEHRIVAVDAAGDRRWDASVEGFAHGLDADGTTVVVPCAQNFRVRDPETHGLRWYDLESGDRGREPFAGVATAASIDEGTVAAIEEPVEYHDEGEVRGEYALHAGVLEATGS